jgi:hypothetical protein
MGLALVAMATVGLVAGDAVSADRVVLGEYFGTTG